MGVTIEFYCLPIGSTPMSLVQVRASGRLVSSASINSIFMKDFLASVKETKLSGLFVGPRSEGGLVLIPSDQVAVVSNEFVTTVTGAAKVIVDAYMDAADEAIWRGSDLIVGAV